MGLRARIDRGLAFTWLPEVGNRFLGGPYASECGFRGASLPECLGDRLATLPPVEPFRRIEGDAEVAVGIDVWLGRLFWNAWDG